MSNISDPQTQVRQGTFHVPFAFEVLQPSRPFLVDCQPLAQVPGDFTVPLAQTHQRISGSAITASPPIRLRHVWISTDDAITWRSAVDTELPCGPICPSRVGFFLS